MPTQVVKDLIASFDIITSTDNQGNTALHVAGYRGYLTVVEVLILSSPSSASIQNHSGDTFLHMAVSGFQSTGFRRLDRQMELMEKLLCEENIINPRDIINIKNNSGRTVLHIAVMENIHFDLVELIMAVHSVDLNIRDNDGMTPLDLLKQRPRSPSSNVLIKRLISEGGVSKCDDYIARTAIASHLKMQGNMRSPGSSFRIPDAEIFLYADNNENPSEISSNPSSELTHFDSVYEKRSSVDYAKRRLKILLQWPKRKEKRDDLYETMEENLTPLRLKYSNSSSLPNNRRVLAVKNDLPSPETKKKFAAGLMHGVIQPMLQSSVSDQSPSRSSISSSSWVGSAGPISSNQTSHGKEIESKKKQTSYNKGLMNQYICFGAQGVTVEDSVTSKNTNSLFV